MLGSLLKYSNGDRNRKGFTLIELLVVISIIALLLSILMPALGKARDQAKTLVCSSKQKQLLVAWTAYAIDNDDSIMHVLHGWDHENWNGANLWWVWLIGPYVNDIKWSTSSDDWIRHLSCPSEGPLDKLYGAVDQRMGMNEWLDPFYVPATPADVKPTLKLSQIRRKNNVVVFTDSIDSFYTHRWGNMWVYRHRGYTSSNFALADGHVETEKCISETGIDFKPDGVLDAYPPRRFIYYPNQNKTGWPLLDYQFYEW